MLSEPRHVGVHARALGIARDQEHGDARVDASGGKRKIGAGHSRHEVIGRPRSARPVCRPRDRQCRRSPALARYPRSDSAPADPDDRSLSTQGDVVPVPAHLVGWKPCRAALMFPAQAPQACSEPCPEPPADGRLKDDRYSVLIYSRKREQTVVSGDFRQSRARYSRLPGLLLEIG